MRALPLIVLTSTVAVAVVVRIREPPVRAPRAALATSPSAQPDPLPRATLVPADRPVAASAPRSLHGDPHHTHRAHGHVPQNPRVSWRFDAGGPIEAQVVASPDEQTLYVTTLEGTLWALARDGQPRFHVALGARSYGTPCVAPDGTVYVGTDGGAFYAVAPDGRIVWKLSTPGDADTAAALLDGLVVFAAGSRVYGVSQAGTAVFRFQAKGKVFTAPAVTGAGRDARLVFGSQDHRVWALTPGGELAWATDLGTDVDGSPAIADDGAIFVGTDAGEVVELAPDGHVGWRRPVGGFVRGALSVARNGDVMVGVYGPAPRMVRLSADGAVLGAFPVRGSGTPDTGVLGGPLEDDVGTLVFGAQDGLVHAVLATGLEAWAWAAHGDVDAPITLLGDGTLLVGTYGGEVLALGEGSVR